MSNLLNNMQSMTREQLVQLAISQGLTVHHKAKAETIIKQIMDNAMVKPEVKAEEKPEPKVAVYHTPEQVEEVIASIKQVKPDFQAVYESKDGVSTVTFRYRGAEECHNLTTALPVLKRRAGWVARGRMAVLGMEGFESINNNPKNAYTGAVLSL